jgi:hypothetical protein
VGRHVLAPPKVASQIWVTTGDLEGPLLALEWFDPDFQELAGLRANRARLSKKNGLARDLARYFLGRPLSPALPR